MSGFEITCINKGTDGMLVRIGGNGWSLSIHEAVTKLVSQQLRFYVRVKGEMVDIGIRGSGRDAYLTLEPEGIPIHNLVTLPSC